LGLLEENILKGEKTMVLKITKMIKNQVFVEYPGLKISFENNVPHKMKEEEFWKKFFKSHYFHRKTQKLEEDSIFSSLDEKSTSAPEYIDPFIDLTNERKYFSKVFYY
jgi:transcription initiation factor TFIIH subunit 1